MAKRSKVVADNTAIGYVRVSTAEQAEEGVSLDAQEARIRAYCTMRDLELIELVTDPGVSAGKYTLEQREGGAKLLGAVTQGKVTHVVALKLDRLFRNTIDCLTTVQAWDKAGVSLHLIDMGGASLDTSSAMGRMFLTMAAGFAEMEKNLTAERTTAALSRKAEKNERTGELPYGKRLSADEIHLEDNPEEQAVIAKVRKLQKAGLSQRAIVKELAQMGMVNRAGGAFNQTQVARIQKGLVA